MRKSSRGWWSEGRTVVKTSSPVKRYPPGFWNEDETRGDEEFRKIVGRDTHLVVSLKIEARLLQQLNRLWGVHVFPIAEKRRGYSPSAHDEQAYIPDAKLEVKLPCRDVLRKVAFFVREGNANLDELQEIDVASHCLVVIV